MSNIKHNLSFNIESSEFLLKKVLYGELKIATFKGHKQMTDFEPCVWSRPEIYGPAYPKIKVRFENEVLQIEL